MDPAEIRLAFFMAASRSAAMLRVEEIGFSYGASRVLDNISFRVAPGELCGLFGPNGCGKTTLFKCCLKFLKSDSGRIFMAGRDTRGLSIREMARCAAYVPQEHKPPFPYRVREVVLMGRTPHMGGFFGIRRQHLDKAMAALELLEIAHLAERPYNQLSGGQRQMVLIARAIAQETRLVFLDEPTSALDFKNQITIWRILRTIADRGITIVACSHDPNHMAWFCDKVVVLNERGMVAQGAPAQAITQEVLDRIYRRICRVKRVDGLQMVLPRGLAPRHASRALTATLNGPPKPKRLLAGAILR
jgi:iron complex transport system ATP-binding protein